MSYILEALKKSEAERNRNNAAMRLASDTAPPRGNALWQQALVGALLINAAAIGGWWYWRDVPADMAPAVQTVASTTLPVPTEDVTIEPEPAAQAQSRSHAPDPAPSADADLIIAPGDAPVRAAGSVDAAPAAARADRADARADTETLARSGDIVRFQSLPMTDRANFPELEFSTHLYASNPEMRRVVVNGQRAQEGDSIAGDIIIDAITETGVVVRYRNRRVAIDVIQGWRS